MSRPANPTLVGIFALLAAFLGMGTIIFVASGKLFRAEETVIVYFGESVNGLTIGSPVKFKGVPIGEVKDIRMSYNQSQDPGTAYIPVFINLNLSKMGRKSDFIPTMNVIDPEVFEEEIRSGLRAKLNLLSFITGQLYVELDYFDEPGSHYVLHQLDPEFKEIPSLPSDMEELGATATDILAQFATVDIKQMNDRILSLLERLDVIAEKFDIDGLNSAIVDTADSVQSTLNALDVEGTMPEIRTTIASLNELVNRLSAAIDPAVENYHETLDNISATLERGNQVLDNVDDLTSADSTLRRELLDTLEALQDASQSAEQLLSYLERNPRAVLSGRVKP
ncbi:MAG: MlaD family protein [Puniceicoccaceae bacterium]